ncbi:hypothetical protein ACM0CO_25225 [Mycobacteroides abscessus subsp. abscessus]|uniref:hypothetical protein n=1 Tax=Mycobacteroides abscessus TaxID=36809 RepID=UPI0039F1412A
MTLLLADKPVRTDTQPNAGGNEELAPVHLSLPPEPDEFDRLAEYACTVDGFAAAVGGQLILTQFLAATDEPTYVAAAQQAARDATAAGFTITEFDYDLVNTSDIADRINCSRQAIRQYIQGTRGPGGFPARFGHAGHSDIWDWGSVNTWFRDFNGTGDPSYLPTRIVLDRLNGWLRQETAHGGSPGNCPTR